MFFNDWIQRKLAALLHPWLRQGPERELELKLGFLRSQGIAKNLTFDTLALNQLLDDSARFLFTDFRVDELSLGVSNWSAPAFTIVVDGLNVTLSEGEVKESRVNQMGQTADTSMENTKKVLSKIDPEGSALHDAMERISNTTCLSNWKSSILNTILAHCHVQMRHIHLLVQCPSSNNSFSCLLEIEELDIESRYSDLGCLLREVVSSLVLPSRENYLAFEFRGCTIGLKSKDHISNIFSSRNLQPFVVLKDLQLINFNFSVPELEFTFSPSDMFTITMLNEVPAKESKRSKTGKQLWRIAASRMSSLIPARRWSFQKLVNLVCLWMHYVHAYEHLLSSVGYPVDNMMKRSATMMYRDKVFSRSVKQQWKTISEIEKELPVEAVVLARQLVRCRAAVTVNQCKDSSVEFLVSSRSSFFWKLLHLLAVVWSSVGSIFYSIIQFLLLQFFMADHPRTYVHRIVSDDACPQRHFSVNIGRLSITISPEKAGHPNIVGRSASDIRISDLDLLSFCVSVDAIFFVYKENVCEQFLSFSCGNLKAMSSSVVRDNSNNYGSYLKRRNKKPHDSLPILWGQPAQFIDFAETATGSSDDNKSASVLFLGRLVQEMWLTWKNCTELEDSKLSFSEHPFILCEIKSFLTDQGLNHMSSGSWNCCLVVGKLNLMLGYSSILSLALIVKQIQCALRWRDSSWRVNAPVHTPMTCEDLPTRNWDSKYNSFASGVEIELYKMLPEKLIQIGVFIAGPRIQISLIKEGFYGEEVNMNYRQNGLHIVFDMHNFELAIKPTSVSDLASTFGDTSMHDEAPDSPRLKEPELTYIPTAANKNYGCLARNSLSAYLKLDGLNAYIDDSTENQQHQIIVLNPTTFHLSSIRKELYSLGATVVAFSAALRGITSGLVVLLFIDEFTVLAEVVVGLTSVLSNAFVTFDSVGSVNFEDSSSQEMVQAHSESMGRLMTGGKMGNLILSSIQLVISCAYELKSLDIVLHNSRKNNNKDFMKVAIGNKELAMHEVPNSGVCISIKQSCIRFSCKERKAEILANFSGFRAVIFKFVSEILKSSDQLYFSSLLLPSLNCLQELSVSDCTFILWLRSLHSDSSCGGVHSDGEISHMVEDSPLTTDIEWSRTDSSSLSQKFNVARQSIGPASSHWVLINIGLSEIYLARSQLRDILFGAHKMNKLESSLSMGVDCRKISWQTQGGFIFLETEAVVMFFQCFSSYQRFIGHLLPVASPPEEHLRASVGENMAAGDDHPWQERQTVHQNINWEKLDQLTIGLSEFSLVLVARDESGTVQEFLLEADVYLNVEIADRKKFLFRLSHLSILSHILRESVEQQSSEIQISQFSSVKSSNLSSPSIAGDPTLAFQHMDGIHSAVDDASSSSPSISPTESHVDKTGSQVSYSNPQNYILKQLGASFALEKPLPGHDISHLLLNQQWVGGGSISGFDMTISLHEIQLIFSAIKSLSGVFSNETTNNVGQQYRSRNQEAERSFEEIVPDGTIVALQDIHQHIYITVEGAQNNYSLVGAIHYSVVGERALFRVKYHYQRRWKSQVLWVSLTSLHAKNGLGEPLRLNYRAGSGFVDISSSSDTVWALWKIIPFKHVSCDSDNEVESYNHMAKNTFHLVNRKNDRAIAFADGTLEFVSKPGNPFKWKVFRDFYLACDTILLNSFSLGVSRTSLRQTSDLNDEGTSVSERTGSPTGIIVEVDKLTLTIVHEISDTKDKVPLLQGSIIIPELIVQILSSKARILSRLDVVLYCFDAQRNLWRELLHPTKLSIFYRYRFQNQGSEMVLPAVPVHFYARIKGLDISMTELSLDILLFVIGKLNIAGPFAVRSSVIFANCCKVENQSGVTLRCHFYENQVASVARKQASMIFLRHLALVNQPSDASVVTIQLTERGSFSTSPIHISLLEDRTFTWRTRIVSSQDSKTYPGPFIVVEISRKREDGLSFVVSPLLRIHNETDFSMELRFQRPQHKEAEFASVILKTGDTIDDSLASFGAINLSGGLKKALVSLSVGNFLFSFRPEIKDDLRNFRKLQSADWSDDLKGGKAVLLSGLFDKLGYQVRKAFSVESVKCSFSTAHCSLKSKEGHIDDLHFLIQSIGRDIPVIQPDSTGYARGNRNSPVALQEQKEIFILPTIQISNLLQSEIKVVLTDKDPYNTVSCDNIGKQAIIPCGSTANLYANPATIYFTVTLTAFSSSCKPVNSADWVKKLQKQRHDINSLDIELDFGSGKYFAFLRLSFKDCGILEAAIFTSYTLKNDTDFLLFCSGPNQKPLSRDEAGRLGSEIPTELGSFLPAKSTRSWFMKYNKVRLTLLEGKASDALLDLDALSGLTEIDLEGEEGSGFKYITKLGVSLRPSMGKVASRIVSINPRYVVSNESEEVINVRQCYLEDDIQGVVAVDSKQRTAIQLRNGTSKKREISIFENFLRNHRYARDDALLYVQFQPKEGGFDWSGPVCVVSLGQFFLKFKRSKNFPVQVSNHAATLDKNLQEFSSVNVIEEDSTLVLHFNRPPNTSLPYRIENCLEDASISYYQKGSSEPEILEARHTINYVWDDLTLPHKLVIQINDVHLMREINLDKVRAWKPFYRVGQQRGLGFQLPLERKPGHKKSIFGQSNGVEIVTSGYEIYADGPTRVLRICEFSDSHKADTSFSSGAKMKLRISNFAIRILEHTKKERDTSELPIYTPIIVIKLWNINMDSLFTNQRNFNRICVQSLNVDQKWEGAPFVSMIRRHQSEYPDRNDSMLRVVVILLSSSSKVKQVEYSSIVLQPLDLNLDEETLMRIVPFWRTSLSDPNTPSQLYYFDHFEIHPIKILASFLPGEFYSSYSSTQEMLRSLLHSVIKIPAIKNKTVELNGVLVTHALITIRELSIKCAKHYSWYATRAIYIAKGSPLLPPTFASIFDDSASSSLDAFFDPSSGLINLPGLTIGTFKLISKCIDGKGFSGTKRYFGDLGKTLKTAGSNILFAAVTEISDSVLKGAETSGFNGMISGFHQGILKLAMEPAVLGSAFLEGGPDRKIKLDRNPGVDELYIEGYLQAMLDAIYKQEYLRVRVVYDQVILKNLPPNSSLIEEIVDRVKSFLVSKTLLKGDSSTSHHLRHLRGESDWKIGPTVLTLCEHLFVSFMIRGLRKQAGMVMARVKWKEKLETNDGKAIVPVSTGKEQKRKIVWKFGIGKFVLSAVVAYLDGRLCRHIPNPIARRIVSGFLLTFLDTNDQ